MNVMGIMQQIMSNNRVMGNPMIKNAMSMAQSGNSRPTWMYLVAVAVL